MLRGHAFLLQQLTMMGIGQECPFSSWDSRRGLNLAKLAKVTGRVIVDF